MDSYFILFEIDKINLKYYFILNLLHLLDTITFINIKCLLVVIKYLKNGILSPEKNNEIEVVSLFCH